MASGGELWAGALAARPLDDERVLRAVLDAVTDLLASSLAARREADVARLLAWATRVPGGRRVPGHVAELTRADAALVGGFQAHALDLDDTHAEVRGHPSAVVLPALLALSDADTPGADLLAAHVVGVEVMARLGRLSGRSHHAAGWHPTATLGAVAAAVAGSRLRGLDAGATASAAGLAASQAGGTRAQFGTAAKPLHAGLAAAAGVRAVEWAQAGLEGSGDALFGRDGLAQAMAFESADAGARADAWGEGWAIVTPGLWFKRYPFCSAAMSAHEAAGRLAGGLDVAAVRQVRVSMRPGSDAPLRYTAPRTGAEGRFSSEYVVGLALCGVPAVNERFVELDAAALRLAARTVRVAEGAPSREPWARVEILMADGGSAAAEVGVPLGAPGRPLTPAHLRAKLDAALGAGHGVREAIDALPHGTVGDLDRALTRATTEGGPP